MTRSGCMGICASLALALLVLGCGSSNSSSGSAGNGGGSAPWDKARIGNPGTGWWMNAVKGKFFFSVKLKNSYAEDANGRTQTVLITKTMAAKSGSNAEAILLKPNETPGKWINDPDQEFTKAGPVVATNFDKAVEFIDGGADPFYTDSYKAVAFAWGQYKEDDASKDVPYGLDLRVWEMASAANASTLYDDLLNNSLYNTTNWTICQGGDANNPCP